MSRLQPHGMAMAPAARVAELARRHGGGALRLEQRYGAGRWDSERLRVWREGGDGARGAGKCGEAARFGAGKML